MTLLPTLRQKKRYLVCAIDSEKKFTAAEVKEEVEKALLLFLGQLGVARAGTQFISEKFDAKSQQFIIKVGHKYVDEVKSALILIKKVKNTPVILRSVTVSGMLKKASGRMGKEVE